MNIVDIIVVLIVAIFVAIFYRQGLIIALRSFVSFFIATIMGIVLLEKAMGAIYGLGWKENVFTPLALFPLIIIIFWGVLASILTMIPIYWQGKVSSALSVPVSIIYGLCVCVAINLVLPQLVSLKAIDLSDSSFFSQSLKKVPIYSHYSSKFLSAIDQELTRLIIVPKQNNETIILNLQNDRRFISSGSALEILELTNRSRQDIGLFPLKEDKLLDALALSYADEILRTKRFSHISSDGKTPDERAKGLGLKYNYMGENLAIASTVESAHSGLMASDSHRINIESPIFRNVGIAVLDLGGNGNIIVEEFAN